MSLIIPHAPMTMNQKTGLKSEFFPPENQVEILDYLEGFILHAPYRKKSNGEVGLRKTTLHNYTNFRFQLQNFLKDQKRKALLFTDLNRDTVERFTRWLLEEKKYSQNHSGRIMATLKTLARDAKKNEIAVHPYIKHVSGFSQQQHKRIINILTFGDLRKIEAVVMKKKAPGKWKKLADHRLLDRATGFGPAQPHARAVAHSPQRRPIHRHSPTKNRQESNRRGDRSCGIGNFKASFSQKVTATAIQ